MECHWTQIQLLVTALSHVLSIVYFIPFRIHIPTVIIPCINSNYNMFVICVYFVLRCKCSIEHYTHFRNHGPTIQQNACHRFLITVSFLLILPFKITFFGMEILLLKNKTHEKKKMKTWTQ